MQSVDHGAEVQCPDQEQIGGAARRFSAARDRAEDERHLDVVGQRCKRFDQDIGHTNGLPQDAGQFRIDLVRAIRRVLDLITDALAVEQPGFVQAGQLLVERPGRRSGETSDLPYMELSFGVQEQQRQDLAPIGRGDTNDEASARPGVAFMATIVAETATPPPIRKQRALTFT